jgi:hypothetical protein
MSTRSSSLRHLSRRATALASLALALFGLASFTTAANANFTLSSGTIRLTDGSGATDPPSGSWVTLPADTASTTPPYFTNPSTTWTGSPDGKYTLIKRADSVLASTGLRLGRIQSAGGIFGDATDTFGFAPWQAITTTTATTGATPTLTFSGTAAGTGTRTLVSGDLSGLRIRYGGGTYDVSTTQAAGGKHTVPLTGEIVGATTSSPTITLDWTSDLVEPGFSPYRAHFRWVGTYTP